MSRATSARRAAWYDRGHEEMIPMATPSDRQEAARVAYDLYTKAYQSRSPIGPGLSIYSFYDDRSGRTGFFTWGHHHVIYAKLSGPFPGLGVGDYAQIFDPRREPNVIGQFSRYVLGVPGTYAYVAVFDMASPTWAVPIQEWPANPQVSVRGWLGGDGLEEPCPWSGTTYPLYG
jgi:hypothetical protein